MVIAPGSIAMSLRIAGLEGSMADKFDRFSRRARQSLSMAQEEARRLNHGYIGTEHLLLGLLREEQGGASRVLRDMGLSVAQVRRAVVHLVGRGERMPAALQLAEQTKQVIEVAVEEAKRLNHPFIDTEHLLLALLYNSDSMAAAIFEMLNVNREIVRRRVLNLLQQEADSSPSIQQRVERQESKKKSLLEELGVDMTRKARKDELDPVIGRQKEIERVIQILARRTKNNPALIGEPGVGKTAIVEGLAQRIVDGKVPEDLADKRVVRLDVGSLVAGTMYRGQFEERLKQVIEEIESTETVLFIDELHMLVGAGSAGSSVDAANILKPAGGGHAHGHSLCARPLFARQGHRPGRRGRIARARVQGDPSEASALPRFGSGGGQRGRGSAEFAGAVAGSRRGRRRRGSAAASHGR